MLDTLSYIKKLQSAGFSSEQAEAQIAVLGEIIVDGVATKKDLELQSVLTSKEFVVVRSEFAAFRSEMSAEFLAVRSEIRDLEHRMTIRLGSMMVASSGITIGLLALILK